MINSRMLQHSSHSKTQLLGNKILHVSRFQNALMDLELLGMNHIATLVPTQLHPRSFN